MVVGSGSGDEDDCGFQKAKKNFIGEPEVAPKAPSSSGRTDEMSMTVLESESRKNMLGPQSAAILASQLSVIHEVGGSCGGSSNSSEKKNDDNDDNDDDDDDDDDDADDDNDGRTTSSPLQFTPPNKCDPKYLNPSRFNERTTNHLSRRSSNSSSKNST